MADQRPPIQELQPGEYGRACHQGQPESLIERAAFADRKQVWKWLRLGASFDRCYLLNHHRQCERGEHVEMLLQLA